MKRIMKKFDEDGDGRLDFDEFERFIKPRRKERAGSIIELNFGKGGSPKPGRRGSQGKETPRTKRRATQFDLKVPKNDERRGSADVLIKDDKNHREYARQRSGSDNDIDRSTLNEPGREERPRSANLKFERGKSSHEILRVPRDK